MHKNRLAYIDNLRLYIIILVIAQHLAITYSGIGYWYYITPIPLAPLQTFAFLFYLSFTQGYFMGLLFLIAGYFIPSSYDKKGFSKFTLDRLNRLGIPTLIFIFILHPLTKFIILSFQHTGGHNLFVYYADYIISFDFVKGMGPLWFTLALLVFTVFYALIRKLTAGKGLIVREKGFPGAPKIFALVLLIGVCTFFVRIYQPVGTNIMTIQFCFFAQYIIMFIIGIKCRRNEWFEKLDYRKGVRWLISGVLTGFIGWEILLHIVGALNEQYETLLGGIGWLSAAYAVWESFVAVSMSIGLLALFREKLNKQNRFIKTLSDNAFPVFVFHTPFIVTFALLMAPVSLTPVAKFFILVPASIVICFLFSGLIIRKISFLRRLL